MLTKTCHCPTICTEGTSPARMDLAELPAPWLCALLQALSPVGRHALFSTCRALAQAVLQHAASTHITLCGGTNASGGRSRGQALAQLLQPATRLHLVLDGSNAHASAPEAYNHLRARVTRLTLQNMTLTSDLLRHGLQLQALPQLQTLVLGEQVFTQLSADDIASLAQHLPPSLHHLVASKSCSANSVTAAARMLSKQLTHLESACWSVHPLHHLLTSAPTSGPPTAPSLTHFSTTWALTDSLLDALLTHFPHLAHVTARALLLGEDHSSRPCGWQQLHVLEGARVTALQRLPAIHRVTVHRVLRGCGSDHAPSSHRVAAPCLLASRSCQLQCAPAAQKVHHGSNLLVFDLVGCCSPHLLSLCARSLTQPACLRLECFGSWSCSTRHQACLACLQQLQQCRCRCAAVTLMSCSRSF